MGESFMASIQQIKPFDDNQTWKIIKVIGPTERLYFNEVN